MSENLLKYRFIEEFLPTPSSKRLAILTGARQTGKTTSAKRRYPHLNYLNLDSPENREAARLITSASWAKNVGNSVIDEAQKEPIVFEKIKYAYDEGDVSFSLLLGSSQILLLKKVRESLAGRASVYEIWPLMMSEILYDGGASRPEPPLIDRLLSAKGISGILNKEPEVLLGNAENNRVESENHLLRWGGMPALLPLSDDERWRWLKDYEYTYLETDLGDLARLSDLVPFRTFQRLSALRSGQLLNYSELARDAAVSADTARRYLEYLRLSYQTILIQPYYKNLTSSVVKTPKLYWLDVGLLRQLGGLRGETTGQIYETMVVGELIKWLKTAQRDVDVFFYRTRSGLELDVLLQPSHGFIGIETKARKAVSSKDFKVMKEVAGHLGKSWLGGLVVYRGSQLWKLAEPDIWAVPSHRLFT